jgi:hypothetical protein
VALGELVTVGVTDGASEGVRVTLKTWVGATDWLGTVVRDGVKVGTMVGVMLERVAVLEAVGVRLGGAPRPTPSSGSRVSVAVGGSVAVGSGVALGARVGEGVTDGATVSVAVGAEVLVAEGCGEADRVSASARGVSDGVSVAVGVAEGTNPSPPLSPGGGALPGCDGGRSVAVADGSVATATVEVAVAGGPGTPGGGGVSVSVAVGATGPIEVGALVRVSVGTDVAPGAAELATVAVTLDVRVAVRVTVLSVPGSTPPCCRVWVPVPTCSTTVTNLLPAGGPSTGLNGVPLTWLPSTLT